MFVEISGSPPEVKAEPPVARRWFSQSRALPKPTEHRLASFLSGLDGLTRLVERQVASQCTPADGTITPI